MSKINAFRWDAEQGRSFCFFFLFFLSLLFVEQEQFKFREGLPTQSRRVLLSLALDNDNTSKHTVLVRVSKEEVIIGRNYPNSSQGLARGQDDNPNKTTT